VIAHAQASRDPTPKDAAACEDIIPHPPTQTKNKDLLILKMKKAPLCKNTKGPPLKIFSKTRLHYT
jgi:hypothetical protein